MMPAAATSESVSVDLPWSTCAMTDIERMFRGFDWISCSWVRVKLTCAAGAARSEKGAPARARRAARQLQYESRWEQGGRLRVLCCSRGADAALVATAARPHEANGASRGVGGGVPS